MGTEPFSIGVKDDEQDKREQEPHCLRNIESIETQINATKLTSEQSASEHDIEHKTR
jgi:hypothetical protein